MKKNLLTLFVIAAASTAMGADLYVNPSAAGNADGSKGSPFKSLNMAIEAAQDGDVIKITKGTIVPDPNDDPSKHTFQISGKTLTIEGGYNDDFSAADGRTTLSGDTNGDDVYDEATGQLLQNYDDNCDRVITVAKESNVTLRNLIIKGGKADNTEKKLATGGGMYIGAPVTMENCVVTGNRCKQSDGGGGLCVKGDLTMNNCVLYGNVGSGDGGAMYIKGDINVFVTNCRFETNKSTSGSAVFLNNAISCYFSSNSFTNNVSETYGTFTVYNKSFANVVTVVNNTFANNEVKGNTTGKKPVGGSAIYAYLGKDATINVINNTLIGNTVEGYDANGDPSEELGGALLARQGKVVLANNVIAGNYSLGGYGDVYKADAAVIDSKEYNFFTSYDNLNVTPERNDIVAGLDRKAGMAVIPTVFDCSPNATCVTANCVDNGGVSKTVKVIGENIDFDGLNIKSLPAENLSESFLGVDVDNDGNKTGKLLYDQRRATRNQTGSAYIGAYEDDGITTSVITNLVFETVSPYFDGHYIIVPGAEQYKYSIYSISGQLIISGIADSSLSVDGIEKGVYLVVIETSLKPTTLKIIL